MLSFNRSNPVINQGVGSLEIIIPAYKSFENIYIFLVGTAMLFVWGFWFEVPFESLQNMVSWAFISLGFVLGISLFVWGFFGKEELLIKGDKIELNKTAFGIGKKLSFSKSNIKEFSIDYSSVKDMTKGRSVMFGKNLGRIRFSNQGKIHAFGLSLSIDDAEKVKKLLNERLNVAA